LTRPAYVVDTGHTLLPPSPREWLSEDHQVYFLLDLVDEQDLSEILIPVLVKDPRGEKRDLTGACRRSLPQSG